MNNLTQTKQHAKQAYLNRQQDKMLVHYQNVDKTERSAIIKQIDSFLPVTSSTGEKTFWIEFRDKLKRFGKPSILSE